MPHPPYSLDEAPCDFYPFPFLKKELRGQRFAQTADVIQAATNVLNKIPECEFLKTFDKWIERWDRCIENGGRYFKKESLD